MLASLPVGDRYSLPCPSLLTPARTLLLCFSLRDFLFADVPYRFLACPL